MYSCYYINGERICDVPAWELAEVMFSFDVFVDHGTRTVILVH